MSDRVNSFLVVLETDMHEDEAKRTLDAIMQIRGVISVTPNVADVVADSVARSRVRLELITAIIAMLQK